jgi:hypothetical protein
MMRGQQDPEYFEAAADGMTTRPLVRKCGLDRFMTAYPKSW